MVNTKFEDGEHPTKFDLDKVSTEIPISVSHASGHLAAVNSKALELYGYVGEDYEVPEGGVVRTVSPTASSDNISCTLFCSFFCGLISNHQNPPIITT